MLFEDLSSRSSLAPCLRCGGRLLLRQSEGSTRDALEPVEK